MRSQMSAVLFLILIAIVSCGGPAQQTVPSTDQVKAVFGDPARQNFENAYFEIACFANAGKDPLLTIVPLEKPLDFIAELRATGNTQLGRANTIVQNNGFESLSAFLDAANLLKDDAEYWSSRILNPFIDRLLECGTN